MPNSIDGRKTTQRKTCVSFFFKIITEVFNYIREQFIQNKLLMQSGFCSPAFIIQHICRSILHFSFSTAMNTNTKNEFYFFLFIELSQHLVKMKFRKILPIVNY